MKAGPVILALAGIALLLGLYFSPVTPGQEPVAANQEEHDHSHSGDAQNEVDARVNDALQKMESGELPPMQAVMAIRDIAEEHPDNLRAQFTMGVLSMKSGQFEKAVQRFDKVIEINPQYIEAYRLKGRSHLSMGDTSSASESFDRALDLADKETRSSIEQELVELKLTK